MIIGITAYITASGPLAKLRQNYLSFKPLQEGDTYPSFLPWISNGTGVSVAGILLLIGIALITLPMFRKHFRRSASLFWSMLIGGGIAVGWVGTSLIATLSFAPITIQSHTFSLPLGDSLIYLMTSSGSVLKFSIGSVLGVILGDALGSLIKQDFFGKPVMIPVNCVVLFVALASWASVQLWPLGAP